MKIAIYDTEHFETAYTLTRIFDDGGSQVTLFATPALKSVLDGMAPGYLNKFSVVLLEPGDLLNAFNICRYCRKNSIDVLFLNTVAYHHILFGAFLLLLRQTKIAVTVHDANSFFRPASAPGLRGLLRYCGKKLLKAAADYYITLLSSTKEYIEEKFHPASPVTTIPGGFFENKITGTPTTAGPLVIVIPGSVDTRRRNYDAWFKVLQALQQRNKEIEFVLLGGAKDEKGAEIIRKSVQYQTVNLGITIYKESFIPQEEYDRQLLRADFLYAPLQKEFSAGSAGPESYGLTKSSGVFFDAIRFGKPLLIAADIYMAEEIKGQCIVHQTSTELAGFLSNLTSLQKEALSAQAIKNSENFTLEKIRKTLPSFLPGN